MINDIDPTSDMFTDSEETTDSEEQSIDTDSEEQSIDTDSDEQPIDTDSDEQSIDTYSDDDISVSDNLEKKMLENKTFPSPSQENFQYSIYVKRDFSLQSYPPRDKLET